MFKLREMLQALQQAEVDFVVVGGVAASAHGAAHVTQDLDVCYSRAPDNLGRLVQAVAPYRPRLRTRGVPEGLPFLWDVETLRRGLHFTLQTRLGDLDLLAEIPGLGTYERLRAHSVSLPLYGSEVLVLDLENLIRAKEATGREKDRRQLPELQSLLALRRQQRREDG